jgi:VanZ family protein
VAKGQQKLRPIVIGSTVTIVFLAIITLLSLAPIQLSDFFGPVGVDKGYHVVAYFCLVFPLPLTRPRLTTWVVLGVIACGGSIEFIQYLFGRETSLGDFVANGIGAIVGAVIARQLGLWLCRSGELKNVNN